MLVMLSEWESNHRGQAIALHRGQSHRGHRGHSRRASPIYNFFLFKSIFHVQTCLFLQMMMKVMIKLWNIYYYYYYHYYYILNDTAHLAVI